jgi:hypothetical protein
LRERDEKVCVMSHLDCVLRVFCKLDICSLRTIEWQATSTVLIPATFKTDSIPVITEINHCEKVVENIPEVLVINQKRAILFVVNVKDFFFLKLTDVTRYEFSVFFKFLSSAGGGPLLAPFPFAPRIANS